MEESRKYLSIIVPTYNEEENVHLLHERLHQVLSAQKISYEVIYVDDGSKDGTFSQLQRIIAHDPDVKVVRLQRNFGQTAAISAGVAHSTGEILIFMDGDLQNDPVDIPRLIAKLNEGYDVVSGWRKKRQDAQLSRRLPSMLANRLISKVSGVYLHDYGCTLKAYRREVFQHVRLYGEMHRFIPAYAAISGASVTELEVAHHPRRFGVSKYNITRTVRVILDLMTLKFLGSFGTKPHYAFGIPGLVSICIGSTLFTMAVMGRVLSPHKRIHRTPLLPVSIHFSGLGMQCIMMGLLAELLMRTYHESQGKSTYVVKSVSSLRLADAQRLDEKRSVSSNGQIIALSQPGRKVIEAI